MALLNVENRFNRRLKYPYVLFMTESELASVSEEDKAKIDWITDGRAKFGTFFLLLLVTQDNPHPVRFFHLLPATVTEESWEVPEFLDKSRVQHSLNSIGSVVFQPTVPAFFDI